MRAFRTPAPYVAALLGFVLVACGVESLPSGPASASTVADTPVASSSGSSGPSGASLYKCETPDFGSVSKIIGRKGGEINVGPHSLKIPGDALRQDVRITATASAGEYVRIELEPHGLEFARPAELRLSYEHCDEPPPTGRYVAYVDDLLNVLELLEANLHKGGREVETELKHFSGYAVAE
jgi:hypothetical protein